MENPVVFPYPVSREMMPTPLAVDGARGSTFTTNLDSRRTSVASTPTAMHGAPCSTFSRAQHDAARKDEAAGHARNVSSSGLSGQALGLSGDAAAEPRQSSGSQGLQRGQTSQLLQLPLGVPSSEEPPPRRLDRAGAAVRRALSEGAQDDRPGTRRRILEPLI